RVPAPVFSIPPLPLIPKLAKNVPPVPVEKGVLLSVITRDSVLSLLRNPLPVLLTPPLPTVIVAVPDKSHEATEGSNVMLATLQFVSKLIVALVVAAVKLSVAVPSLVGREGLQLPESENVPLELPVQVYWA